MGVSDAVVAMGSLAVQLLLGSEVETVAILVQLLGVDHLL